MLTFVKINNKNLLNTSMKTYNLNKALYESIMNDIAKTVKRKINEADANPIAPRKKLYD